MLVLVVSKVVGGVDVDVKVKVVDADVVVDGAGDDGSVGDDGVYRAM